jgi:hypothetical protein
MLPPTPTQHYLFWIRLKISFVTSFTISKWLKKHYFSRNCPLLKVILIILLTQCFKIKVTIKLKWQGCTRTTVGPCIQKSNRGFKISIKTVRAGWYFSVNSKPKQEKLIVLLISFEGPPKKPLKGNILISIKVHF